MRCRVLIQRFSAQNQTKKNNPTAVLITNEPGNHPRGSPAWRRVFIQNNRKMRVSKAPRNICRLVTKLCVERSLIRSLRYASDLISCRQEARRAWLGEARHSDGFILVGSRQVGDCAPSHPILTGNVASPIFLPAGLLLLPSTRLTEGLKPPALHARGLPGREYALPQSSCILP